MQSSGACAFLAEALGHALPADQTWLIYLAMAAFALFLTELASNTTSAALLVPLFMPLALELGADPATAAVLVGTAASCALMLPVATPPNALVFGTGAVPQWAMVRTGFYASILAAVVLPWLVPVLMS
jgi:sodium-dependent dicarboxylate transporter 2/3/5